MPCISRDRHEAWAKMLGREDSVRALSYKIFFSTSLIRKDSLSSPPFLSFKDCIFLVHYNIWGLSFVTTPTLSSVISHHAKSTSQSKTSHPISITDKADWSESATAAVCAQGRINQAEDDIGEKD